MSNLPRQLSSLLQRAAKPTVAQVPHRAVLSVTGTHAVQFLNGLISSTIPAEPANIYTSFLHAQGRVLYDVFIYSHETPEGKKQCLVEYDSRLSEAPPLLPMLKRYVLHQKARLRDVSEEYDVWQAWGSEADSVRVPPQYTTARSGVIEPDWQDGSWPWGTQPRTLLDRRGAAMGRRLLVRKGDRPTESASHDVESSDAYTMHRILNGVPEGIDDLIPTHSFPMESDLDLMGALDFRKGCYVGQELTVRTYHTGILRKRIWPVIASPVDATADSEHDPSVTLPLHDAIKTRLIEKADNAVRRPRPRGSGKMLSSVGNVGLALLRIEHVFAARAGDAVLELEMENADGEPKTWKVTPWDPAGWPEIPAESVA